MHIQQQKHKAFDIVFYVQGGSANTRTPSLLSVLRP
jgi:hypothetical protein